jgi:hypothetical protein
MGMYRLYDEELNDLYTSHKIFRVKNSRKIKWEGHEARIGEMRDVYQFLQELGFRGIDWIELAKLM